MVGPNGSGKSNVIDSLLFVLGRRATQIRLKKLSELIHNSTQFPPGTLKECRVDIHFAEIIDIDDKDAFEVVEGSQFVVSRIANHESKSTYKLNDRTCTSEDVQSTLKGKGMDLDNNRFLILQGEVESIALMKPKGASQGEIGILEYLEDLIGTNQYVQPIEQLGVTVEERNEERQIVLGRVKTVEKEREALEGPKDEAQAFVDKNLECNIVRVQLAQLDLHQLASQNQEYETKKAALAKEKAENEAKLVECASKSKELEREFTRKQDEHDAVARTMTKCKNDFAAFERKDAQHRELLKGRKAALKKCSAKNDKARQAREDLQAKIKADAINLPKVTKKEAALREQLESEESTLESMHAKLIAASEPFKIEIEQQQKNLIPLQQEANACQQSLDVCTSEINLYKDKLSKAESKYNEVKASVAKAVAELDKMAESRATIKKQSTAAQNKLRELNAEMEALVASESTGLKRRTQLLGLLEDSKNASASQAGQSRLLQALMAAKKKGSQPGLYGRLGDLASIEAKYDVAVTTGVGWLNHLVVATTADGRKAIDFVRSNQLGRAALIALDKMDFEASRFAKMENTPEGVPRLFDLLEIKDARFAPALYFACRDTLVAQDMTQATRIAYGAAGKRWRVVTLDGKVIEMAGTMSGGGTEVRRGGMHIKSASSKAASSASSLSTAGESDEGKIDVKATEAELTKLEGELGALRLRKRELEAESKLASADVRQLENALSRAESESKELTTSVSELKARAQSLEKSVRLTPEDLAALKELEGAQSKHQAALAAAKKNTKSLTDKIATLQAKIMERGGAQLAEQQTKVDRIKTEVATLQEELNRMTVLAETGAAKLSKLAKEEAETQSEVAELEEAIEKLTAAFKQIEEDALAVHQAFKAAESSLVEAEKALDAIQVSFESVKAELSALKNAEVDLEEKRLAFRKEMADHLARYQALEQRMKRVQREINKELWSRAKEVEAEAEPVEIIAESKDDAEMQEEKKEAPVPAAAQKKRGGRAGRAAAIVEDADDSVTDAELESFPGAYVLQSDEELAELDRRALERKQSSLEHELASLKPNPHAILSWKRKDLEYNARVAQLDTITLERDIARKALEDLRKRRLSEFMSGFSLISMRLKEMYQMLTLGGDAELECVDSLDPFSEGVVFSVRPPKKSWKQIQNLSGGEKTLSSLALVFALHHFKPTPLYVMDEIDAALDFKNVSIVANYIKERTKDAQFIIISLRNNMFELADRLVGIYKTQNVTKSITIDPRLFNQQQQQAAAQDSDEVDPEDKENAARAEMPGKTIKL